ncbi:hypothetical protein C8K66_10775 [Pseudomonas sp. GV105]|nr:hypothetical protein C8K66_10775 [Pseudomonas sp. GV105]
MASNFYHFLYGLNYTAGCSEQNADPALYVSALSLGDNSLHSYNVSAQYRWMDGTCISQNWTLEMLRNQRPIMA